MKVLRTHLPGFTVTLSLIFLTGCAATVEQKKSPAAFGSTVEQTSKDLLRPGTGENWKPDSALAREIQRHKPGLATLVEDANWIVALSAALEGPSPEAVKKSLRQLHTYYAEGAPHEDVAKDVEALLPKIKDEALRRELKKLANRSWDRDRRPSTGSGTAVAPRPTPQPLPAPISPVVRADDRPPREVVKAKEPPAPPTPAPPPPSTPDTSIDQSKDRVDSLMAHGQYLEALRALEMFEDRAEAGWVKTRRLNLGNRYCEERRSQAANAFVASRKAKKDSLKDQYLRQSMVELDSCLFQFPNSPVTEKVRRNRALVEKELHR